MTWIALDGGATKTVAAVFNEQKEIEGLGIAGPSNYRNIGIPNTVKNIKKAVQGALEQSGKDRNNAEEIKFPYIHLLFRYTLAKSIHNRNAVRNS